MTLRLDPSDSTIAYIRAGVLYAWRGSSVLVTDHEGAIDGTGLTGFFFREARYLSRLTLTIDGRTAFPCSAAQVGPNVLEFTAIHPEVEKGGGGGSGSGGGPAPGGLLYRGVDVRARYTVRPNGVDVSIVIRNRWNDSAQLALAIGLAADYTDLLEAQSGARERQVHTQTESLEGGIRFYNACESLPYATEATVCGTGTWRWREDALRSDLELERGQEADIRLRIRVIDFRDGIDDHQAEERDALLRDWQDRLTRVVAPGDPWPVSLTRRSSAEVGSFALLEGSREQWLTPGAGYPLYPALFGRDALTAAWQLAMLDRGALLDATLSRLSALQGERTDPQRDEQPGRIVQQARHGPLARLGANPFARYYGDYASPFVFLIGTGQHYLWTGDRETARKNWDHARRVLDWAREHADADGDGYLEYLTLSAAGPKHQGWKDSDNAVVDEDGKQVDPPVAACEVQGYYHIGLQLMAAVAAGLGERATAFELWRDAAALKERFNRDFWLEDEGCVAFGLNAAGAPIRSITSNAAQCLATGIVSDDHAGRLVRRIFEPDMFSGWGIRTLSSGNASYNPLSYHLGSVWPVENGTIVFGLRRYGFRDRTQQLARALFDLAALWPAGRTPECVGGYARDESSHPGAYPRANAPQAWNQSTPALLLQSMLGIWALAPARALVVDPDLPAWLPEVTLRGLRVGEDVTSIRFRREADGRTSMDVLEQSEGLRIVRQPPPDDLTAGALDRIGALLGQLLHD
jgi:glycogen debranching enzyme